MPLLYLQLIPPAIDTSGTTLTLESYSSIGLVDRLQSCSCKGGFLLVSLPRACFSVCFFALSPLPSQRSFGSAGPDFDGFAVRQDIFLLDIMMELQARDNGIAFVVHFLTPDTPMGRRDSFIQFGSDFQPRSGSIEACWRSHRGNMGLRDGR